jgi:hypothetical protein
MIKRKYPISDMTYTIRISKWKIIGLFVLLFFILLLMYTHYSGNNPDYQIRSEKTVPKEYWYLFRDDLRQRATVVQSLTLKYQNPISELSVDDGKYFIEILKLNVRSTESLNSLITLSDEKKTYSNGVFIIPWAHYLAYSTKLGILKYLI